MRPLSPYMSFTVVFSRLQLYLLDGCVCDLRCLLGRSSSIHMRSLLGVLCFSAVSKKESMLSELTAGSF